MTKEKDEIEIEREKEKLRGKLTKRAPEPQSLAERKIKSVLLPLTDYSKIQSAFSSTKKDRSDADF